MKTSCFNILLVDDEADFLEPLAKRLKRRQLRVECAGSGMEALEIVYALPIDVVVLDVKMPGLDGLETLRAIKSFNPLIEVIMLSGHACLDAAIQGMENGAFDYLMKPLDIDELFYKLQDAYQRKTIQEQKIEKMRNPGGADERGRS